MKILHSSIFLSGTLFIHDYRELIEQTRDDTLSDLCNEMKVTF